ncbi:quinoprotein dehydrogenase-associated SoxYZ-like carrier [Jiella sp. MQZ9-1]|uniref:Quinoprotein dehydrogenase-associated SoxYZ-like carrier n=1 Tax=Jiella flava TaxID=2816857 RepID=A0A939FXX7_9HYPH|nr:quinoprotein dehydrogenase-associated SoxYZ-like carrier [Jiella flava]MBO0662038.1 quinoprotein dehydrogenase-associated SoxYZ-like carrier [Jiella flava]MCD2470635.1 quinoprotein dehydrogenase-associated SoxYZ-like carrier [Jiella flava]
MTSIDTARRQTARKTAIALISSALALFAVASQAPAETGLSPEEKAAQTDSAWPDLKSELFGDKTLIENTATIAIDAPKRATDPAVVPVKLTFDPKMQVRKVTLVIDENPSPVAATFAFADGAKISQLSTRVRVNAYTNVHAVAETADGKLYVTKTFVKAAGGCAAPASKDPETASREMGKMKMRVFKTDDPGVHEAQLMIRHPNNSGLQKDQVTLLYIPAHFITDLELDKGGKPLFTMTGGISISEDPSFRFRYGADDTGPFHAKATDTENMVFEKSFDNVQS